jgi:hypothetical protein
VEKSQIALITINCTLHYFVLYQYAFKNYCQLHNYPAIFDLLAAIAAANSLPALPLDLPVSAFSGGFSDFAPNCLPLGLVVATLLAFASSSCLRASCS